MEVDLEVTYAACLLECGPLHLLYDCSPIVATVGDANEARKWFKRNQVRGWTGGYYQGFYPWWVGYKEWYVENLRGN